MIGFIFVIASLFVLAQFYVVTRLRRCLFQRFFPISRRSAYTALGIVGLSNVVFVRICFGHWFVQAGSASHKTAAVLFFNYLGLVMTLAVFFLFLTLAHEGLRLVNRFNSRSRPPSTRGEETYEVRVQGQATRGAHRRTDPGPNHAEPPAPSRRLFLKYGAITGLTGSFALSMCGVARAYSRPTTEFFELPVRSLGNSGESFTLIHVSDFHYGFFWTEPELEAFVGAVNAVEGDVLAITGDVYHSSISPIERATPILSQLRPRRLGSFAVLGNHDFYAGVNRSAPALREAGLTLLRDEWIVINKGKTSITLGGIDDPLANWLWGTAVPGFTKFASKAPSVIGPRILLSHRPAVLPFASRAGIDLVLAGHTHGGQIVFPMPAGRRGLSLARVVSPYTYGWYREGGCAMYVNRGAGLTFVPWRLNCPPEITVIRVRPDEMDT